MTTKKRGYATQVAANILCWYCGFKRLAKNGKRRNRQRYICRRCGSSQTI